MGFMKELLKQVFTPGYCLALLLIFAMTKGLSYGLSTGHVWLSISLLISLGVGCHIVSYCRTRS